MLFSQTRFLLVAAVVAACSARGSGGGGGGGGDDASTTDTPMATDTVAPTDTGNIEDSGGPPVDTGTVIEDTGSVVEDTGNVVDVPTPPVDTGPNCAGGQILCGGACVNVLADLSNCGSCGRVCQSGQVCNNGACMTTCPSQNTICSGACVNLPTDPFHCGACNNVCPSGQMCSNGACQSTCTAGQTRCGSSCVTLATDTNHCGQCGRQCTAPTGGSVACTDAQCVGTCPSGQMVCNAACVNIATDTANCGTCGNRCPSGVMCNNGSCNNGTGNPDDFRIESLGTTNCRVVDHGAITGDDNAGIALSSSQVFYTGDTATGRYAADTLSGGVSTGAVYYGLVHDLGTGAVFTLGSSTSTPMPAVGATLTHLLEIDGASGVRTGRVIALSQSIAATVGTSATGALGIFSGVGRALIWVGGRVYDVNLTNGVVTPRAALTRPAWVVCESIGVWGVAESFGGALYVVYRTDNFNGSANAIVRTNIATGATTLVSSFTSLSDLCAFTVSPTRNRWYFHHEGTSQFTTTASEALGYCDAVTSRGGTTPQPTGLTLRIDSLGTTSCTNTSNASITSDDRPGIAITSSSILDNGDVSAARHSIDVPSTVSTAGRVLDGLVSDFETQQAWVFATSASAPVFGTSLTGTTITHLIPLVAGTGAITAPAIALSRPLTFVGSETGTQKVGIFSGRGRALVYASGRAYDIALPSGVVTDLGAMTQPSFYACEGFGVWGVAESFGGSLYMTYRVAAGHSIVRTRVPDGMTTTVATFTNLGDTCSLTVSPLRQRWYFHNTGGTQFTSATGEFLSVCPATIGTQ